MKAEEMLQRLFYVDTVFTRLKNKISDINKFNKFILDLKNKTKNKSIKKIEGELKGKDLPWFKRLNNQNCKILELELSNLCIDDYHDGIYIGEIIVKRGDKIEDINKCLKNDARIESLMNCSFLEELILEIPIVVRPYQKLYEIISGNHRLISALRKGKRKIKCLCFCESSDKGLCNSLSFN